MLPTLRATLLFFLAAILIALGTWAPLVEWFTVPYLLIVIGLLVADWRMAGKSDHLSVSRQFDSKLSLGADNPITLIVRNGSSRRISFWVRDESPPAFRISQYILKGQVPARQSWQGVYYVHPLRRGDYSFGDLNLRWVGPLKLVVRQECIPASRPVKVYPNLLDVKRYDLLLRRNRLQEMGLRHSRMFGEGTEFERLRDYMPDDDFRRIDWKATARYHRPITVEYQTERSQNVIVVLDIGRMMQSPVNEIAKLDYVVNAVLLLAYVVTGKGDKVGLLTFADTVTYYIHPQKGRGQFYRMLEALYAVEAQPVEPNYQQALNYLMLKQRKRSLVVIFTDISGGVSMQALVSQVRTLARSSLSLVVTISDPDVHAAAVRQPIDSPSVYQGAIANRMIEDRQVILQDLHRQGVWTLDTPANQLSASVINRYLELKGKTLI